MEWTPDTSALASAIAAVASAVCAAASFVLYWRELNARRRENDPVVELDIAWVEKPSKTAGPIYIALTVRNPLNCKLKIGRIKVVKPGRMKISFGHTENDGKGNWYVAEPILREVSPGTKINPHGTSPTMISLGDHAYVAGRAAPPLGWDGGKVIVKVELIAAAERRKRIVKLAHNELTARPPTTALAADERKSANSENAAEVKR